MTKGMFATTPDLDTIDRCAEIACQFDWEASHDLMREIFPDPHLNAPNGYNHVWNRYLAFFNKDVAQLDETPRRRIIIARRGEMDISELEFCWEMFAAMSTGIGAHQCRVFAGNHNEDTAQRLFSLFTACDRRGSRFWLQRMDESVKRAIVAWYAREQLPYVVRHHV